MGRFSETLKQRDADPRPGTAARPVVATASRAEWVVVGGEDSGGIVVREGEAVTSKRMDSRLSHGARLLQVELGDGRLHYERLTGSGPTTGWVSLKYADRDLVARTAPSEKITYLDEAEDDESLPIVSPVPESTKPGLTYEVVVEKVAIRAEPSTGAQAQFQERKGSSVHLFGWDSERKWRQVEDKVGRIGWMLLDSPDLGPLLRPVGMPHQYQPLDPVCVAAWEGDSENLETFLREDRLDANASLFGGQTALMLAAQRERHECVVVLIAAKADYEKQDGEERTVFDHAESEMTVALLHALTGRVHPIVPTRAISNMKPDIRSLAERLISNSKEARAVPSSESKEVVGDKFKVVYKTVPVRNKPSTLGALLSQKQAGDFVEVVDYDDSGRWVKIAHPAWFDKKAQEWSQECWMLTEHPDLGDLLERVS